MRVVYHLLGKLQLICVSNTANFGISRADFLVYGYNAIGPFSGLLL